MSLDIQVGVMSRFKEDMEKPEGQQGEPWVRFHMNLDRGLKSPGYAALKGLGSVTPQMEKFFSKNPEWVGSLEYCGQVDITLAELRTFLLTLDWACGQALIPMVEYWMEQERREDWCVYRGAVSWDF